MLVLNVVTTVGRNVTRSEIFEIVHVLLKTNKRVIVPLSQPFIQPNRKPPLWHLKVSIISTLMRNRRI